MRRLPLLALLSLLVACLIAPPAAAQVGTTTDILRGRVTDERGEPIAGAQVEAISLETEVRRTTATGKDGRYTIVFPEGGGRYQLRVSYPGVAPALLSVARHADEEVLLANVQLLPQAIALEGLTARARRTPPPGRGDAGAQERVISGELASRLPLENPTDAAELATLSPGVVGVAGGDSLDARGGFSVAGQRASQNQITLDGASFGSLLSGGQFGGSPLGVPQEGVRTTQVITSTYDVARGQFTGGQVATSTRSGTNRVQGSLSYQLRDDALQGGTGRSAWTDGYTQNRVSGGIGGPVVRDRLFYNLSFTAQRRSDAMFALLPRELAGLGALGAAPDSVSRFLDILQRGYGVSGLGETGAFDRTGDAFSGLARVDWNLTPLHTLALRGFGNGYTQANARIGQLELRQSGGEMDSRGYGGVLSLTSRFGAGWVNELRASLTRDTRDMTAYTHVPEGRVRVSSTLADGGTGITTLAFGGDRLLPTSSGERTLELADELSFLYGDAHRIRTGALFNYSAFGQNSAPNRLGSFSFNSLADFEAGRAASFTRSLSERQKEGAGWSAGLYLGDTWRPTAPLQLTYGVRLEGSRFAVRPAFNPRVDSVFGLRTDRLPADWRVSPRVGFSWRLSEPGEPLRLLRGGLGEFRGRAPFSLYAGALDQTGIAGGELQLVCIGDAAPLPDWAAYAADAASIPALCLDGEGGRPTASGAPNVTTFTPNFGAPLSWRASLGYQTQLLPRINASLDANYARGRRLYGVVDRNLRGAPAFRLAEEGDRPVYTPASGIDAGTGEVALQGSRIDPRFAHVFEVGSDLGSETVQLALSLNGVLLPSRLFFQTSYTLAFSRDQSSFSFGSAQQGFAGTPARRDPNHPEWTVSDLDRRHSLTAVLGMPIRQSVELSLIGRASSGAPFTPLVGGDVNGDGARNDPAFLFDPARAADPAVAAGIRRVLADAPARVASCLRRQLGSIAERNSCRDEWSHSLDLRATLRPTLPAAGRRLSVSMDALNLGAGLDLMLHGAGSLRGWGQRGRTDAVLLYPRGFDAQAGAFHYEVNERFGQNRAQRFATRSPFGVQLSARMALGPQPRPAGGLGGVGAGGGAGGGGFRGGGSPGGAGGRSGEGRGGEGGGFGGARLLERALPEPIAEILALADTLGLTPEQVARLGEIGDTLRARNAPIRAEIRAAVDSAGATPNPAELFRRVGPRLNEGRVNVQNALDQAEKVLTPEQWRRMPATLKSAVRAGGGGRGGG